MGIILWKTEEEARGGTERESDGRGRVGGSERLREWKRRRGRGKKYTEERIM